MVTGAITSKSPNSGDGYISKMVGNIVLSADTSDDEAIIGIYGGALECRYYQYYSTVSDTAIGAEIEVYVADALGNSDVGTVEIREWTEPPTVTGDADEWGQVGTTVFGSFSTSILSSDYHKVVIRLNQAGIDYINNASSYIAFAFVLREEYNDEADWVAGTKQAYIAVYTQNAGDGKTPILKLATSDGGLDNAVYVDNVQIGDITQFSARQRLNDTNEGKVTLTNVHNANASTVSRDDIITLYRKGSKVLEGVAMAPQNTKTSPPQIDVNILGYGGELARKAVYNPQSYVMERGRTLTVADIIKGYPYQHGDGTFDGDPSSELSGWKTDDATATAETSITNKSQGSWKIVTSDDNGGIGKILFFDQSKISDPWLSVWVKDDGVNAVTLGATTISGLLDSAVYVSDTSSGSGEWERLEVKWNPTNGAMRILSANITADSGATFYVDDFCYCVHLKKDGYNDIWDNGILANTGYAADDAVCPVEIDSFDTRGSTTINAALRSLRQYAGENDYCWWYDPYVKQLHFRAYNTTALTDYAKYGTNIINASVQEDVSKIINSVTITSTSYARTWEQVYSGNSGYNITKVWQRDDDIILHETDGGSSVSRIKTSNDNGATWSATKSLAAAGDTVWRFDYDDEADRVFACCSGTDGMLYSDDRGATWSTYDATIANGQYLKTYECIGDAWYEVKIGDVSGSGKIYVREYGDTGSWTDKTPTIAGVTNFYHALTYNNAIVAIGYGGNGVVQKILYCQNLFVPAPSWGAAYTTAGNYSTATGANGFVDGLVKYNQKTGYNDYYYALYDNTPAATVLRSQDYGQSWTAVFTSVDGDDGAPVSLAQNDGYVYLTINGDADIRTATTYGRLVASNDDGDTWATVLDGDSTYMYPSDVDCDLNTVLLVRQYDNGSAYQDVLLQRIDAYNISVTRKDETSIDAYGEYRYERNIGDIQTSSNAYSLADGLLDLFADPITTYDVMQTIGTDIDLELNAGYNLYGSNTFPLTFPITFGSPIDLPSTPQVIQGITYNYPANRVDLSLGKDYTSVNSAFSGLINHNIDDSYTDDTAVCIQDGDDDNAGIFRHKSGKIYYSHGVASRGGNYVMSRLRSNGRGRARAW